MALLDLSHKFFYSVAPPVTLLSLLLFLPPYLFFKFFLSILGCFFSEDVAGKVVIVTGASSGIGESLAYEYARRGACLTIAARRESVLREVAEKARVLGSPDVLTVQADISKMEDCRKIIDQTMSHFGRLDHLVNNAGVTAVSLFEETEDITKSRYLMDINFWGTVYITKFAIPYLRSSKGRVIVISSSASWLPTPRMSLYSASKAAVSQFFETLRIELGQDIKITLITPGYAESEMTQGKFIDKSGKEMGDVQLEDSAKAIVNGACRGEKYVTAPAWFRSVHLWKVFCPQVVEWILRFLCLTGTSPKDAVSKKILDSTSVQKGLYPETIQEVAPKIE